MIPRLVLSFCFVLASLAVTSCKRHTVVEFSSDKDFPTDGSLSTAPYKPTSTEKPYHERLPEGDRWTIQDKPAEDQKSKFKFEFNLRGHKGQSVAWSGIIRKIDHSPGQRGGTLLIENKYAGDATDGHIQTVSINGGGDFKAALPRIPKDLIPLVLVRVYGVVEREENSLPVIRAEYVRVWQWFQFNFMDYGEDHGNPEWKKNVRLKPGDRVYHSGMWTKISLKYYVDRLGTTPAQLESAAKFQERRERAIARHARYARFLDWIHAPRGDRVRLIGLSVICGVLAGAFTRRLVIMICAAVGLHLALAPSIYFATPFLFEGREAQSWQLYLIPMIGLQTFLWSLAAGFALFFLRRAVYRK